MRLLARDLTTVYLKKHATARDEDGEKISVYLPDAVELKMNVQSAGGSIAVQQYGDKLPYIKSCKYQGDKLVPGVNERDGVCLYVSKDDDPDYEIISIHPYRYHLNVMLEKLVKP